MKKVKRLAAMLLAMVLLLTSAVQAPASGNNTESGTGYSVTFESEGQGSLSFTGSGTGTDCKDFAEGDTVSVSAVPEDGYAVSIVTVNDADGNTPDIDLDSLVSVDGESMEAVISFTMPACDVYVTVEFAPAPDASLFADATDGAGDDGDETDTASSEEEEPDGDAAEEEAGEEETDAEEEEGTTLVSRILSLFSSSSGSGITLFSASSTSITYKPLHNHPYNNYSTWEGQATLDGNVYTAFCLEPSKDTPTANTYSITEWTNDLARAVAYYGYAGPGYENSTYGMLSKLFGGDRNNQNIGYAYVYQHLALAYVYNGNDAFKGVNEGTQAGIVAFVENMLNETCYMTVPTYFHVYQFCTGSSTYQTECFSVTGEFGYGKLIKASADTSLTSGREAYYHLGNAIYGVYKDSGCTSQVGTLTTTADGSSNGLALAPGTYYVKEISASTGYQLDPNTHKMTVTAGNTTELNVTEQPMDIYIWIKKTAYTDSSCTTESTVSKGGAKYGLYTSYADAQSDTDGSAALDIFTTDSNGDAACAHSYPLGVYYVKELESPDRLALDETIHKVDATSPSYSGQWYTVSSADIETSPPGTAKVKKTASSSSSDIIGFSGNSSYSLADAVFGVYTDSGCQNQVGSLTTDANGDTEELELKAGTYYIREISASPGYDLNTDVHECVITSGNTTTVTVEEPPRYGYIELEKSRDTSVAPLGYTTSELSGLSLADAKYQVFATYDDAVAAKTGGASNSSRLATLTTDSSGYATSSAKFAIGTYYLKEVVAPEGLAYDEEVKRVTVVADSTGGTTYTVTSVESPEYGYIKITKDLEDDNAKSNSNYSVANAEFGIYKSKSDAENDTNCVQYLVTDGNGEATSGMLKPGTYYVKETPAGASMGCWINEEAYSVEVVSNHTTDVTYELDETILQPVQTGLIEVHKKSGDETITEGNSNYDLSGAEYTVYLEDGKTEATDVNGKKEDKPYYGTVEIYKTVDTTDVLQPELYGPEGAEFTIYSNFACTNVVATVTTDEYGHASYSGLTLGKTYYVKETGASKGCVLNTTKFTVKTTAASLTYRLEVPNSPNPVPLTISKSADADISSEYTYEGIRYGVYSDSECKTLLGEIELDADGKGTLEGLDASATYYVKETQTNDYFELSDEIYKVDMTKSTSTGYTLSVTDGVIYGKLRIYKSSANASITYGNSMYDLTGATFGVYTKQSCTASSKVGELTIGENQYSEYLEDLLFGTYYVKELTAPEGYLADTAVYPVEVIPDVAGEAEITCKVPNNPAYSSLELTINKKATDGINVGSLEGTQFTVYYYDGQYTSEDELDGAACTRRWVIEAQDDGNGNYVAVLDKDHCVEGAAGLYYDEDGNVVIPLGTVVIKETRAADGYSTDGSWYDSYGNELAGAEDAMIINITQASAGSLASLSADNVLTKCDSPYGGLTVVKQDSSGKTLGNVTYDLYRYNEDSGEYEYLSTRITSGEGVASWDNLVFGTYQIREVSTQSGYTLLKNPIDVVLPYNITVKDAEANGVDTTDAYLSEDGKSYNYINLTYTVTDGETFDIPDAGYVAWPVLGGVGIAVLAFVLLLAARRRRIAKL